MPIPKNKIPDLRKVYYGASGNPNIASGIYLQVYNLTIEPDDLRKAWRDGQIYPGRRVTSLRVTEKEVVSVDSFVKGNRGLVAKILNVSPRKIRILLGEEKSQKMRYFPIKEPSVKYGKSGGKRKGRSEKDTILS